MPTSKLMTDFGIRLAQLRKERHFTHEKLAEAAGISLDFLSLIERGLRAPSFSTLERLAKALEINIKDLFGP